MKLRTAGLLILFAAMSAFVLGDAPSPNSPMITSGNGGGGGGGGGGANPGGAVKSVQYQVNSTTFGGFGQYNSASNWLGIGGVTTPVEALMVGGAIVSTSTAVTNPANSSFFDDDAGVMRLFSTGPNGGTKGSFSFYASNVSASSDVLDISNVGVVSFYGQLQEAGAGTLNLKSPVGISVANPVESLETSGAVVSHGAFSVAAANSAVFDFNSNIFRFFAAGPAAGPAGSFQWFAYTTNGGAVSAMTLSNAGALAVVGTVSVDGGGNSFYRCVGGTNDGAVNWKSGGPCPSGTNTLTGLSTN